MLRVLFAETLSECRLLSPNQQVLLAVSGGVDSMVMLDLFFYLAPKWNLRLAAVHANHQLRGVDSDQDEAFVKRACHERGIPCVTERLDVRAYSTAHRISIQLAARELRYQLLEQVRIETGSVAVATAHHADDNVETVLMNIVRGTGLRGLAGIPPRRDAGQIIRPLIRATRAEIESYATEEHIPFRMDQSNLDPHYARNEMRLQILPELQRRNPTDIAGALRRTAETVNEMLSILEPLVHEAVGRSVEFRGEDQAWISLDRLAKYDWLVQEHAFLRLFQQLRIDPTEERLEAVHTLIQRQTGRLMELSGPWVALRDRRYIVLMRRPSPPETVATLDQGAECTFDGASVRLSEPAPVPRSLRTPLTTAIIDADRVSGRLQVRYWHEGDWFVPFGMRHKKKLSDFFIDQKVPRHRKHHVPVITSGDDIVWVCGLRLDDRFKVTPETERTLTLTYQPPTTVRSSR